MSILLFSVGGAGDPPDIPDLPNNPEEFPSVAQFTVDDEVEEPWDVLGISTGAFLEIVSTTVARVTQAGFAPWVNFNPEARITQVGVAPWSNFNPEARITQVGITVWRTTDDKLRRLVNVYFV